MKVPVWSVTEILSISLFSLSLSLSLSLSIIYTCLYMLEGQSTVMWPSDDCPTIDRLYIRIHKSVTQRYYTHTGAVFCRLDNNNTENAWQSADGRVTLPQLFRDRSAIFLKFFSELLGTSKKRCWTVSRRLRDLRPLSRDRSATFFKIFPNCLKRQKTLFDSQPTVAWPPTTVAWPFSNFFQNFS